MPYFLPDTSESSKTDWLFMGCPGYGAHLHVSNLFNSMCMDPCSLLSVLKKLKPSQKRVQTESSQDCDNSGCYIINRVWPLNRWLSLIGVRLFVEILFKDVLTVCYGTKTITYSCTSILNQTLPILLLLVLFISWIIYLFKLTLKSCSLVKGVVLFCRLMR